VIESNAPGGQAGSSSKIENYLGFPTGISGQDLAGRAFTQAEKFGAQISIGRPAKRLHCDKRPYRIELSTGGMVQTRAIVLATGARYRKLPLPDLPRFEGVGIYYAATPVEAPACKGEEVVVVGGGNSAGQAAVFLSEHARHVHVLVRGAGLADTMSRYLAARIEDSDRITLHPFTEIQTLSGKDHLESIRIRDTKTGASGERAIRHVFLMMGADPNTGWLDGCVALDEKGFVKAGSGLTASDLSGWPLKRPPYLLETSLPGVFAVGDVRSESVKRVASAVGEGSICVQLVHRYLAE
jgi:thioredoxin reductase (NADPH)